jgi:hypothetical protein
VEAWKKAWRSIPRWGQWTIVIVVGLLIIGGIAGDDSGEKSRDDNSAEPARVEDKPEKKTPAETPASETKRAEPADTGRMTSSELAEATDAIDGFSKEIGQYTDRVSTRCATIASAGQLAEASDCVSDAYDGIEDQAGVSFTLLDGLKDDIAKGCFKNVRRQLRALDGLYASVQVAKKVSQDLQGDLIKEAVKRLDRSQRIYDRVKIDVAASCVPV